MADLRGQVSLDFHALSFVYYSAIRLLLAIYGSSFDSCSVYRMSQLSGARQTSPVDLKSLIA